MINISEKNLTSISLAIKDYSGIVLERIPKQRVEKKVLEQMSLLDCQNIDNYVSLLNRYNEDSKIIDDFISEITISESYIFRNPKQFEYIATQFFPIFFKNHDPNIPLRVWSAGCSRGEEPYSVAMIAMNYLHKNKEAKFTINAGDISKQNLQIAKNAVYNASSLKHSVKEIEKKLGMPVGEYDGKGNLKIYQNIKDMVDFHWLNLKDIEKFKLIMKGSDIIFCRNVLIYFDKTLRNKLIETFFNCLNPGGLLFVGESECFPFPANTFELIDTTGSYAYKKPE